MGAVQQPIKNPDSMREIFKSNGPQLGSSHKSVRKDRSKSYGGGDNDYADRAAGLTNSETEKLRDMKHNLAAEYNRKQYVIENERGGIYDRQENSGVKNMFIPNFQNASEDM